MKCVIAGGRGQVGRIIARAFLPSGSEIVVLTRDAGLPPILPGVRHVQWDGVTQGEWIREVDGADVVIGLAGRSVNCRYNRPNRKLILDSRVDSVRALGHAISRAQNPPRVWLQASTATIYQHTFGAPNDEETGILGGAEPGAPRRWDFSIDVAKAWEEAARAFFGELPWTRLVLMRSGMIMSPDRGGVFATLLRLVKLGLGGRAGSGRQFVSWIHEEDFVRAVRWLIRDDTMPGAVNICAPHPLPNADFMRILRRAARVRFGLPALGPMLEVGAFALGTETELILKSRRVIPGRLLERGFRFRFADWESAAADLCRRFPLREQKRQAHFAPAMVRQRPQHSFSS